MNTDYQLRKDIDSVIELADYLNNLVEEAGVSSFKELFANFTTKSDSELNKAILNTDLDVLSDDLTEFKTTLINLRGNLITFNQELINFDKDNTNLAEDLSKLKDNLHAFTSATKKLTTDLSALDSKLDEFDGDVFGEGGLDSQLSNLATVVGDSNSGLVKGLADLDSNLTKLDGDVFGENGLDSQLSNLATVVGDNNSGLVKGLADLDTNLTNLGGDVDGLGDSVDGLLNAVGDNSKGLVKSMNTLQTTVGDSNSGLVKQANDTSASVTKLNSDLSGLNSSLTGLSTTVGDNNGGLVKQLNDLDSTVEQLDDDVFGANGLSSRLTTVEGNLGTVSTGLSNTDTDLKKLVYSLDKLSGYLTDFEGSLEELEDDIANDPNIDTTKLNENMVALFGAIGEVKGNVSTVETDMYGNGTSEHPAQGSLLSDMSTAKTNIGSAQTAIGNVKTDLYGSNQDQNNPQSGSLKKNLQTVKTTVGDSNSGLVKNLNDAQSHIDTVQTDMYGSNKDPSNPQTGSLVSNLETLDGTINNSGGLIDQLGDVGDNIDGVKSEVYGTKTVDGQTVPKESTDTPDSNSLVGRANAVKTDLYGNGTASNPQAGSLKNNLTVLKDNTVPAVQNALYGDGTPTSPATNSTMGKINAVKTDLYGTGNSTNPQTGSLKNNLNTLKDTTVPAVQTALYGNGTPSNPATDSTMGKINAVKNDMYGNGTASNPQTGSLKDVINTVDDDINNPTTGLIVRTEEVEGTIGAVGETGTVLDDIDKAQTNVGNLQKTMYKGASGTGTITNPANDTLMKDVNTAVEQIGDTSTSGTILYDIDKVQTDIGSVKTDTNGNLQNQILKIVELFDGLVPIFVTVENLGNSEYVSGQTSRGNYRVAFNCPTGYIFETSTNKLYQTQYLESNPPLGYYGEWVQISSLPSDIVQFPLTKIYDLISQFFAQLSHTHTKSEITGFSHTHSISEVSNLQSSLNAKQDKSNYSLIADITSSSQTNGTVKLYSDGIDVLIQISGTFTNVNANGNTSIGTVTSSNYLPSMDYVISNNASIQPDRLTKCWIRKSDGAIALSNGTSSTSITIYAQIRYPLANRMP